MKYRNFFIVLQKLNNRFMQDLNEIINESPLKLKRALSIKMIKSGFTIENVCNLLDVKKSFVEKWRAIYNREGALHIEPNYKGSKGFLTSVELENVISYIKTKNTCHVDELISYIKDKYDFTYKSKQSYYDILKQAGMSWKKTEKVNPKKDNELVENKKKEIKKKLQDRKEEILSGDMVVLMEDECHLLWGDTLGYVWGKTNERVSIPMTNEKLRQTYYGAVDIMNGNSYVVPYEKGNGKCTIEYLKYLRKVLKYKKILIFWDGASYHKSSEMKDYLAEINNGLTPENWKITLELFAPNAPEQNPVEDIWLQGKDFLRKMFAENNTFAKVKKSFINYYQNRKFSFQKLEMYRNFVLQMI